MANFNELYSVNVNEKTEKKNGLTYLSWSWAWAEFKKAYPDAVYTIYRDPETHLPYVHDPGTGYMCFTTVTAGGITHEMWLPVMDNRNKALEKCTMFDVNKTIMRCLTKNLAMFGLGLYIYAGEDLPEEEKVKEPENPKTQEPVQKETEPKEEAPTAEEPRLITKTKAAALINKMIFSNVDEERVIKAINADRKKAGRTPAEKVTDFYEDEHDKLIRNWGAVCKTYKKEAESA